MQKNNIFTLKNIKKESIVYSIVKKITRALCEEIYLFHIELIEEINILGELEKYDTLMYEIEEFNYKFFEDGSIYSFNERC